MDIQKLISESKMNFTVRWRDIEKDSVEGNKECKIIIKKINLAKRREGALSQIS